MNDGMFDGAYFVFGIALAFALLVIAGMVATGMVITTMDIVRWIRDRWNFRRWRKDVDERSAARGKPDKLDEFMRKNRTP